MLALLYVMKRINGRWIKKEAELDIKMATITGLSVIIGLVLGLVPISLIILILIVLILVILIFFTLLHI